MQKPIYPNGIYFGWPERILAGVLGVLFLLFGLFFSAVILGLVAIGGLVLAARVWWLRRQLLRQQPKQQAHMQVIEGEYQVLRRDY